MTTFDPRTVRPTDQFSGAPQFGAGQFPGQQFPGPVPPPPPRPSRKRPLAAKIVAGFIAAGVVVGGAGTWIALSDGNSTEVAVQSTSFAGENPTTSPFGTDSPQVSTVAATGEQSGGTPSMYAATTPPSCNNADFLSQLQADPTKLAAFGGVFKIGPGDVPAFVNSLSPVVLRAATAVTDHPFADGAFTEQPAVLAAGTAVLVNSYGEPTVKCFNGNPLTGGLAAPNAVTVTPTPQALTQFRFTTINNSGPVVVPTPADPKPIKGPNPAAVTARYNYDGTVLLSDGRLVDKDGKVIAPKATIPPGGFKNPDGSFTVNGKVLNPDGSERKDILVPELIVVVDGAVTIVPGYTIGVDGVARHNGAPIKPQPKIVRNYDGTAVVIKGNRVEVRGADGTTKSVTTVTPPDKINPDGSITKKDGTIVGPDGKTPRTDIDLPNGTVQKPNDGSFLAKVNLGPSLLNKDGSLPTGAVENADGTVTLKDGTVLNHDGTVKGEVQPDGSVKFTDGSIRMPDGTILNPDGTVRTPATKDLPKGGVLDPNAPVQTGPQNCGVIADTGGGSGCKSPTGPADPAAGITPATGTGTTGGSSSTGSSTSTGGSTSSGSSTGSSSSAGGSQSGSAEGAGK